MSLLQFQKRLWLQEARRARENAPLMIGKVSMQSHVDELAGTVRIMACDG